MSFQSYHIQEMPLLCDFPFSNYCWISSLYYRVLYFSSEYFRKVCSFCWFKWVELLRTEPTPYWFCIIRLPLAPPPTHRPIHLTLYQLCRPWAGADRARAWKLHWEYLICFSILILPGILKIYSSSGCNGGILCPNVCQIKEPSENHFSQSVICVFLDSFNKQLNLVMNVRVSIKCL